MAMIEIEKLDIAKELLDHALRYYFSGNSYLVALHLAGGAEDILGSYLEQARKAGTLAPETKTAFHRLRDEYVLVGAHLDLFGYPIESVTEKAAAEHLNDARNNTKHGVGTTSFDPKEKAASMLERAIENYCTLEGTGRYNLDFTDLIRKFLQEEGYQGQDNAKLPKEIGE